MKKITFKSISKQIKKNIKYVNKEKKRCAKAYSDWKDNEYNCLDNLFIFAVTEDEKPSFVSLNDAVVYYNRLHKKFYLDIDLTGADTIDKQIELLKKICNAFAKHFILEITNNSTVEERKQWLQSLNVTLCANTIAELYFQLRLMTYGAIDFVNKGEDED